MPRLLPCRPIFFFTQQVDEGAKACSDMSMARIVETQSRERWRPVFQHGDQTSGSKMFRHPEIADKGQAQTFESSFDHQAVMVERH